MYRNIPTRIIYALKLTEKKYYIGSTQCLTKRYTEHESGTATSWTSKYPPKCIVEQTTGNLFDEERLTLEYMALYGIENVRGGSYCKVRLPKHEIKKARQQIQHYFDLCYICDSPNHKSSNCPNK
jgi:predicted GIY-YIG superfamily endonuclease